MTTANSMTEQSRDPEREFAASLDQIPAMRRWAADQLPIGCGLREETALLVTEVAGNAVQHGGGGLVRLSITHRAGDVGVLVREHGAPRGDVGPDPDAIAEMRALAAGTAVPVDELAESGRGLCLVELLTDGRWTVEDGPDGRVVSFTLRGCGCLAGPVGLTVAE